MNNPGTDATQIIRRTNTATRARFTSRSKPEQKAPDGTESILGAPAPRSERLTDRRREISGELPAWDLLPPGEITVRRS